jgi:hypothetical protein
MRLSAADLKRFEQFVYTEPNTGCWLHVGAPTGRQGYAGFQLKGRYRRAHRVSYEHHVGPIPEGLILDHLCRVPCCVNPAHLEPVTNSENVLRGRIGRLRKTNPPKARALKTHCPAGHAYTPEGVYINARGARECKLCHALRYRRRMEERGPVPPRENAAAKFWSKITHCAKGHPFSHENKNGHRRCRICEREADARYRARKRKL